MTFIDWFLIQAPLMREVFIAKSVFGLLLLIFAPVFDASKRLIICIFVYASFSATVASLIPDKSAAERIRESIKG